MIVGSNQLSKLDTILTGSMVVVAVSSHHGSPASVLLEESNIFSLIARKLAYKSDVVGGSRGYVQVASADSWRMREILSH